MHVLTARVTELEGRLAGQTARTEAKPPSSDGLSRAKPKSQRHKGLNSTGGQKGHRGQPLKRIAQPDCPASGMSRRAGAMPAIGYCPMRGSGRGTPRVRYSAPAS
ncbi:MAG: DUF6444 domain-containing protein [Burkholderiales bacterium]